MISIDVLTAPNNTLEGSSINIPPRVLENRSNVFLNIDRPFEPDPYLVLRKHLPILAYREVEKDWLARWVFYQKYEAGSAKERHASVLRLQHWPYWDLESACSTLLLATHLKQHMFGIHLRINTRDFDSVLGLRNIERRRLLRSYQMLVCHRVSILMGRADCEQTSQTAGSKPRTVVFRQSVWACIAIASVHEPSSMKLLRTRWHFSSNGHAHSSLWLLSPKSSATA